MLSFLALRCIHSTKGLKEMTQIRTVYAVTLGKHLSPPLFALLSDVYLPTIDVNFSSPVLV
jgi:hypothetical protein